jgi:hypothetical protein
LCRRAGHPQVKHKSVAGHAVEWSATHTAGRQAQPAHSHRRYRDHWSTHRHGDRAREFARRTETMRPTVGY